MKQLEEDYAIIKEDNGAKAKIIQDLLRNEAKPDTDAGPTSELLALKAQYKKLQLEVEEHALRNCQYQDMIKALSEQLDLLERNGAL